MKLKNIVLSGVALAGLVLSADSEVASANSHTMQRGDTVYSIARNNGVDVNSLLSANGITNPQSILVGETITIPGSLTPTKSVANASVGHGLSDWQYETLLAVVQQEGGYDYNSARWVMSTIMNRRGTWFGNDIWDVVTKSGQFEAYGAGHYKKHLGKASDAVKQGVHDVINGGSVHNYDSFNARWLADAKGLVGPNVGGNIYFSAQ